MKKILAIGAHPDDVEFGVAGLLIKEIEMGAQVKIVITSLGEAGSNGTPEGNLNIFRWAVTAILKTFRRTELRSRK
jgi:LmbE family N-acetylglucosaminyl deacetylase